METFIVTPKNKAEVKMLAEVLRKMKIPAKIFTDEEKETIGLGKMIEEANQTIRTSKANICDLDHTPNAETIKAIEAARKGKTKKITDLKAFLDSI